MGDTISAMTAPTLTGQHVTLRAAPPHGEQARLSLGWHAAIQRSYGHQGQTPEMTPAQARAWYEQQQARAADPSGRCWVIEAEGHLVGVAFLHPLNERDRKAHFVIAMFAPSHTGRELGTQATRLVLDQGFGSMNLHRVDLLNDGAIASHRTCGFVHEGRERDSRWLAGQRHDDIIMGARATEFPGAGRRTGCAPLACRPAQRPSPSGCVADELARRTAAMQRPLSTALTSMANLCFQPPTCCRTGHLGVS